jgi:hypothetical protein
VPASRNRLIQDVIQLAAQILDLADRCEAAADTDGCMVLCGELRDCGYRLRSKAVRERELLIASGIWEGDAAPAGRSG